MPHTICVLLGSHFAAGCLYQITYRACYLSTEMSCADNLVITALTKDFLKPLGHPSSSIQAAKSSQPPSPARSQLSNACKEAQTASATFSGRKPGIFASVPNCLSDAGNVQKIAAELQSRRQFSEAQVDCAPGDFHSTIVLQHHHSTSAELLPCNQPASSIRSPSWLLGMGNLRQLCGHA